MPSSWVKVLGLDKPVLQDSSASSSGLQVSLQPCRTRRETAHPCLLTRLLRGPADHGAEASLQGSPGIAPPSSLPQDLPSEQMPSAWGNLPIIGRTCQSQGMMMAGRTPAKRQLTQRHQRSSSFPTREPTPASLETKWALQAGIGFLLFLEKADRLRL